MENLNNVKHELLIKDGKVGQCDNWSYVEKLTAGDLENEY